MKQKKKHGLTILISILILFFTCSTIVSAGTYIYDHKKDKKTVHLIKKQAKKQVKKPNQVPAGTPYKHKKKGKNRTKPKKLK